MSSACPLEGHVFLQPMGATKLTVPVSRRDQETGAPFPDQVGYAVTTHLKMGIPLAMFSRMTKLSVSVYCLDVVGLKGQQVIGRLGKSQN